MNALIFYSNVNTHGKRDATGAFIPEALAFQEYHGIQPEFCIGVDCSKYHMSKKRRDKVFTAISSRKNLDLIAFFGHGWPDGIQFGINRRHIPQLVDALNEPSPDLKVVLYACLAAENDVRDSSITDLGPATDGGFADLLRDELARNGVTDGWVDGHKTAGHTTWNPHVVRFLCETVTDEERGGEGGAYLVAPGSQLWREWCYVLKNNQAVRHWFPVQTEMEIKTGLMHYNLE